VVLVAVVTYLLLGWVAAGLVILSAVFGSAVVLQSRWPDSTAPRAQGIRPE
jgi:hypothetical protein